MNGEKLSFGFHGIWQGTAVLYDKSTRSLWLHLSGECVDGPLKGSRLKPISGRHVLWKEWRRDHPDTLVMAEDDRFGEKYFPRASARRGLDYFPQDFLPTIQVKSNLLPPSSLLYGVKTRLQAKAYPFSELMKSQTGVVDDQVGDTPVVVFFDKSTRSAGGFGRRLDDQVLEFDQYENGLLRDRRTGSLFNHDGVAVKGPLTGRKLPSVTGLQAEWYGWYAIYPETAVFSISRVMTE